MHHIDAVSKVLHQGNIAVIPTDTLYGIVARASDAAAVERVYRVRGRDASKPCIILISAIAEIEAFGALLSAADRSALEKLWPGPVSVIVKADAAPSYLDRGTGELSFRLPEGEKLRALLAKTGPVIAPSANPQGQEPAQTPDEARAYFGNSVDFYEDGARRSGPPSTLVRLRDGRLEMLREGALGRDALKSRGFTLL